GVGSVRGRALVALFEPVDVVQLDLTSLDRVVAHRAHRSRCDRGRAARRTCTTAAITAGTIEVVHAELSSQLASSSRDDVLGSACPIRPERPRGTTSTSPTTPYGHPWPRRTPQPARA